LPPKAELDEIHVQEENLLMRPPQSPPPVVPSLPSVSRQLRDLVARAEANLAAGRHHMRAPHLMIHPGEPGHREMYHIERAFHGALKAASHHAHSQGQSEEEMGRLFWERLVPIFKDLAAQAEAAEKRHQSSP